MNREADRIAEATRQAIPNVKRFEEIPTNDSSSNTSDSDSEASIDSEEWPESPDRDRLPPDSSVASREQSEEAESRKSPSQVQSKQPVIEDNQLDDPLNFVQIASAPSDDRAETKLVTGISPHVSPEVTPMLSEDEEKTTRNDSVVGRPALSTEEVGPSICGAFQTVSFTIPQVAEDAESSASQSESDIEMVVPEALKETSQSRINMSSNLSLPSQGSELESPYVQLKYAPDSKGQGTRLDQRKSITEHKLHHITKPESTSRSSSVAISTDLQGEEQMKNHMQNKTMRYGEPLKSNAVNHDRTPDHTQSNDAADPPCQKSMAGVEGLDKLENTRSQAVKRSKGRTATADISPTRAPSPEIIPSSSLKRTKPASFYPMNSKKRRKFPVPPALKASDASDDVPDPALSARQSRAEWFAAHRSCERNADENISCDRENFLRKDSESKVQEIGEPSNPAIDVNIRDNNMDANNRKDNPVGEYVSGVLRPQDIAPETVREGALGADQRMDLDVPLLPSDENQQCPTNSKREEEVETTSRKKLTSRTPSEQPILRQKSIDREKQPSSGARVIFETFRATYAEYTGSFNHFVAFCTKIAKLKPGRQSIWDDYVVRHKLDYARYNAECQELGEDPMPYEIYYNKRIVGLRFAQQVLKAETLRSVLESSTTIANKSTNSSATSTPRIPIDERLENHTEHHPSLRKKQRAYRHEKIVDLADDIPMLEKSNRDLDQTISMTRSRPRRVLPWSPQRDNAEMKGATPEERGLPVKVRQTMEKKPPTEQQEHHKRQWWQDEETPFKEFVKAYMDVRPGRGNGFAKPEHVRRGQQMQRQVQRKLGSLNVFGWDL